MNRDPNNIDITRDPIYLLQVGRRQWTQLPDGIECDGESMYVGDDCEDILPDWIRPFLDEDGNVDESPEFFDEAEKQEGDHGWPLLYTEWRTESVWLTRPEAERFAQSHAYRWPKWRVYCVCCEGRLAEILDVI